jgi:peptidoglycan hydrolase-like protein with peptidoglycan-binding domain
MVKCLYAENTGFMFNIHSHVGQGMPNRLDDVEFCRLAYYEMRKIRSSDTAKSAALVAAINAVKPSGPFGPDLDAAIRAHQAYQGGTQDGRVSPLMNPVMAETGYGGGHMWLVSIYDGNLSKQLATSYPRLDLHQMCGTALRASVQKMFNM